ncbi:hybrid sensor histidine kinase/response regulator [Collinsella ihumii]|uniref:histidine kinase n=1 Tax=Collinsella ihumii TaxID=1720204 RepID=A0ABT7XFM2_9ACTN|nr:ATP-binding protein [Collinsella ihumii]MDN0063992.1 ATP-binding protein [Collinsella ihumii]
MAQQKTRVRSIRIGSVVLLGIALVAAIVWGSVLVRTQMLENAKELATRLATSYAQLAQTRLSSFEQFLSYSASRMDELISDGADGARMQRWLEGFNSGMASTMDSEMADPYAVIDGTIIAANPWEGDEDFDYSQASWYQGALKARGAVYATDAYTDTITGRSIITLSIALSGSGNVLAFDIQLDELGAVAAQRAADSSMGYALFDRNGEPVVSSGLLSTESPESSEFLNRLREEIDAGFLDQSDASIAGPDGTNLSVFFTELDPGWLSVVTIPTMSLLMNGITPGFFALIALCALLLGVVIYTVLRERKSSRAMHESEDIIRILGNTYFGIYRINYLDQTYTTVKASPDTAAAMGKSGTYAHFMDEMRKVVQEETFERFAESFSCENIRRREQEGVTEFGGRYLRRFGDEYRWVSVASITNAEISNGEAIICFRAVDNAMREEMQRQELLESALETARQATSRQQRFFSNISHDMRTPLNAIVNLTQMIRRNPDDREQTMRCLALLEEAGNQLVTLVNDILDISHIQNVEQSALDLATVDLVECARTSVELARPQAEQGNKVIELHSAWQSRWVRADSKRLGQVLNNLISNAVKYSLEGARVDVTLSEPDAREDDSRKARLFQIEVADTGIGMTEEFLGRIFDPFARETMFAPRGVVGTGLGMPIVKNLVQQMGGEISVSSKVGEGSVFTVTIPLEVASSPEQKASDESAVRGKAADEGAVSFAGRRVLVAEDNLTNQMIAEALLGALEIDVTCVDNGKLALEAFRDADSGAFDAILMDMKMPVMDGVAATRSIRALERPDAKSIPIIAVTANAFAEDAAEARGAGMDGYVTKPIDAAALAHALEEVWS